MDGEKGILQKMLCNFLDFSISADKLLVSRSVQSLSVVCVLGQYHNICPNIFVISFNFTSVFAEGIKCFMLERSLSLFNLSKSRI